MTLIFLEQEHLYYSLNDKFTDKRTDYKNRKEFEVVHGDLNKYSPVQTISATTFLHKFTNEFNSDEVIDKMFDRDSEDVNLNGDPIYTGKNPEYQGCTKEQMKTLWDTKRERACDYGTFIHKGAENYVLTGKFEYRTRPEFKQVKHYIDNCGYELDTAEKRIFDPEYAIAGTVDLLLKKCIDQEVDMDGNVIDYDVYYIADWKTNDGKDLADKDGNQWTDTMKFPLCHLKDLPYWHYALQFSLYRFMLERQDLEFEGQAAVHLKRVGVEPQVIELPYLKDEIQAVLHLRKREIDSLRIDKNNQ